MNISFRFAFLLSAALIAAFAFSASAQSASKVIGRANKAMGGEKALKAVSTWRQTGSITRLSDGASGRYEAQASGGNLFGVSYEIAGFEYETGYNGKSGWARDSRSGLRTLTGDAARDMQAEAQYRNTRWLRAKGEKAKLTLAGPAFVRGRAATAVLMTTAKSSRLRLFFDNETGLLVREEIPRGGEMRVFEYEGYRAVNGIQTPLLIDLEEAGEKYRITVDEAAYNRPIARSAYDFPVVSNEPIPDIPSLLNEIRANADRVDEMLENYSFTEKRIERDLKSNGELVEKSSETRSLTFYKGFRITRTIEKNGRPLSPSDQAKEDRDVQKQIAEIEKKIAERQRRQDNTRQVSSGAAGQPSGEGQRFTIAEALKGSLLLNPRRERFRGREVIVFDYEPNPAFKPQTRNERLFALCTGAVWVDAATRQVVRLDAVLTKGAGNFIAKAQRGASFTLENEIVNDEIWLPARADINLSVRILFAGININNLVLYSDYRRFETEVEDAKVGKPDQ
ncbi:MAG: hypothetical protein KF881_00675 [Acidobacteria bacterium]|nr:hypothetical protein [Acidobacteriota bacterium]